MVSSKKSQKFRQLYIDDLHVIAQAFAALVVAHTVTVAVFFFFLQKIESQKAYRYRGWYIRVGRLTAHFKFQRVPSAAIIRPALFEIMPIDHLYLDIHSTPIREPCGNVENGELRFRVRPVKFTWDKFKVDDSVVAFKKQQRVDEIDQERLASPSGEKIPHEPVVKPVDSFVAYIDNLERNVVKHDSPPREQQHKLIKTKRPLRSVYDSLWLKNQSI
jgi:hypothetical protein